MNEEKTQTGARLTLATPMGELRIDIPAEGMAMLAGTLADWAERAAKAAVEAEMRRQHTEREKATLTRQEVAAMLGVSYGTVMAMERRRELRPVKVGAQMRFRLSEVERMLGA